ncbi:MAG: hypothetical protein AABZ47_18650, partial [Planctomycetota bacterium]
MKTIWTFFASQSMIRLVILLGSANTVFGQTAGLVPPIVTVRPVAAISPTATDIVSTLPTGLTRVAPGDRFFIEIWATTSRPNGFASVYVDAAFDPTGVQVLDVIHTDLFDLFPRGVVDADAGLVNDLGGSHLGIQCGDHVGVAPEWARVAVLEMRALIVGDVRLQSATSGSAILGIAICGDPSGNVDDSFIDFGAVDLVSGCTSDAACDDGSICTDDLCGNDGLCGHVQNEVACDDGNQCTADDRCLGGNCFGIPINGCLECATDTDCDDA